MLLARSRERLKRLPGRHESLRARPAEQTARFERKMKKMTPFAVSERERADSQPRRASDDSVRQALWRLEAPWRGAAREIGSSAVRRLLDRFPSPPMPALASALHFWGGSQSKARRRRRVALLSIASALCVATPSFAGGSPARATTDAAPRNHQAAPQRAAHEPAPRRLTKFEARKIRHLCSGRAVERGLSGAERDAFLTSCYFGRVSSYRAERQQCRQQAATQGLVERTAVREFVRDCVRDKARHKEKPQTPPGAPAQTPAN
jgi:hypothetical protein